MNLVEMIAPGLGRTFVPSGMVESMRAKGYLLPAEARAKVEAGETLGEPAPLPDGPAELSLEGPMRAVERTESGSKRLGQG